MLILPHDMTKAEKIHNNEIDTLNKLSDPDINTFRENLLGWYDLHRRVLPWRALPDQKADPYHVWLSEIMLQQTVVAAVIPYFLKFTEKWPTVHDLAAAENKDVMAAWAGLGYYARARNLHKCAKVVSGDLDGVFPQELKELKALPGIGDYTAAAIRAIAFDKPANVVDGNVERVMARFFEVTEPLPQSKPKIKKLAAGLSENRDDRSGDYAQALMDLGATICTPKSPKCMLCPLQYGCAGYKSGMAAELPRKAPKRTKPEKYGYIFWIENEEGQVLLQKRPDSGLLGGMTAFPTSIWIDQKHDNQDVVNAENLHVTEKYKNKTIYIYHSFTHFNLRLDCITGQTSTEQVNEIEGFFWEDKQNLESAGFPSLFFKFLGLMKERV